MSFTIHCPTLAQGLDEPPEPPSLGQPENFSHLVGKFTIAVAASSTDVFAEEPILLTVRIKAEGDLPNKNYLPERKFLKIITEDMRQSFFIAPPPDRQDDYDPKTRTWIFYYRLQPKSEQVTAIPALELMFYNPALPPDFRYQPSSSTAIPLKVKLRPQVIVAPESMYRLAHGDNVLHRAADASVPWAWMVLGLALPPAGALLGFRLWRHYHPDRASKRRQSRAARQALKALRGLRDDRDGQRVGAVFTHFLRARLDLPPAEPTPVEVRLHLWKAGFSPQLTDRVGAFYSDAESRFAPLPNGTGHDRRKEAVRLIVAVEEASR
jgi:hypothetical protein